MGERTLTLATSTAAPAILVRDLEVTYGSVHAVRGIDFSVRPGEVFGFLGPNGAGKTSTIRVLLDLQRPSAGVAAIHGVAVRAGGGALRRELGFLPGDLNLFPSLTGRETLEFFGRLHELPTPRRSAVLEALGFPESAMDRRVGEYSTGMRQMLGITLAFQHAPRLLILDEPTTGLDPLVRESFLDLVRQTAATGATVFMSSHVLSEVQDVADRVGLIHEGRMIRVDTIENLRRGFPRHALLRYEDGRTESILDSGPPAELLDRIPRAGLVDIEIRPADLKDVFRSMVEGKDGGALRE